MSASKRVSQQPKMGVLMVLLEKFVIRYISIGRDMNDGAKYGV